VAAGTAAFASQMLRLGTPERKGDPEALKRFHRKAGWLFVVLLVPLAFLGARFWVAAGDGLTLRAGFHAVLALSLLVIVMLKVLVVRVYRGFLRMAPPLGMAVFSLALLAFALTAVFVVLTRVLG
jgi:hypothetical protein